MARVTLPSHAIKAPRSLAFTVSVGIAHSPFLERITSTIYPTKRSLPNCPATKGGQFIPPPDGSANHDARCSYNNECWYPNRCGTDGCYDTSHCTYNCTSNDKKYSETFCYHRDIPTRIHQLQRVIHTIPIPIQREWRINLPQPRVLLQEPAHRRVIPAHPPPSAARP
jgi:hypothetical protein